MDEIRVLSPTAILGYGFPEESFAEGLKRKPHVIAVDAGSTDPGPYYLGSGKSFTDRKAVYRDLKFMIKAGRELKIPVLIGSAGGAGAEPHLDWTLEIIKEIAREDKLGFRLAIVHGEIDKSNLIKDWGLGRISPLPPGGPLNLDDLRQSTHIVGQMGVEPFIKALEANADVIVAGRAYDPAVFAAYAVWKGFDPGLAYHMGKILECAAIASVPGSGSDCMVGYLKDDHFLLEPLNPQRKCTVTSVAAHTLYEKSNPYLLPGPGGIIDLTGTKFEQYNENVVKVSGSRFIPSPAYRIKLEGAKRVGYRTVSIAGSRDPVFISKIDEIIEGVRNRVADNFSEIPATSYKLLFHLYGKNGVMGILEPEKDITTHELGIILEAVADTQDLADTLCSFARSTLLHYGYTGRLSTAGNLALLYSPSDFRAGEVYNFSVYHLLEVEDPCFLFQMEVLDIKGGTQWG